MELIIRDSLFKYFYPYSMVKVNQQLNVVFGLVDVFFYM